MQLLFWCKSFMVKAKACVCAFPSLYTWRERERESGKRGKTRGRGQVYGHTGKEKHRKTPLSTI